MTGSTTFMLTRRRDRLTEPELGGMITRHLVIMDIMVMMMMMMMIMMMMCHLSTLMETRESMMTWLGRSCSIGSR